MFYEVLPIVFLGGALLYLLGSRFMRSRVAIAEARSSDVIASALHENTEINRQVLEKLSALDARLATVEKTLTDIP